MKSDELFRAIGSADDELLERYETSYTNKSLIKSRKHQWVKYLSAAACFSLFVLTLFVTRTYFVKSHNDTQWPVKILPAASQPSGEIAISPRWDDMSIGEQYNELIFGQKNYYGTATRIPADAIETMIGQEPLSGVDEYTQKEYTKPGNIYRMKEISSDCAVAVQFDSDSDYHIYRNSSYAPKNLEQMITDLDLKNTIRFGSVWYEYQKKDGTYATIEFVNLKESTIWEMLLFDRSIINNADYDSVNYTSVMDISVSIPLLGYENISLSITREGYITTNILDTGKAFYIGTEQTQAFINYVLENCEGYEIVYADEEDIGKPE